MEFELKSRDKNRFGFEIGTENGIVLRDMYRKLLGKWMAITRNGNQPGLKLKVKILELERRIGTWLNDKTKACSAAAILFALVMFCVAGTLICLGLLLGKI